MNVEKLSEEAGSLLIGRRAVSATEPVRGLNEVADAILAIDGIAAVGLELDRQLENALRWALPDVEQAQAGARAPVVAAGRNWGELILRFDVRQRALADPLKLARFAAQQIAGLLNRFAAWEARETLTQRKAILGRRLLTRKLHARAHGILQYEQGMSAADAWRFLEYSARTTRRSFQGVAEGIIALHEEALRFRPEQAEVRQIRRPDNRGVARPTRLRMPGQPLRRREARAK